jgi:hypothetical protein
MRSTTQLHRWLHHGYFGASPNYLHFSRLADSSKDNSAAALHNIPIISTSQFGPYFRCIRHQNLQSITARTFAAASSAPSQHSSQQLLNNMDFSMLGMMGFGGYDGYTSQSAYLIERARSNRSHCKRSSCSNSKKNGDFIQKGCVRLKCSIPSE